MFEAVVTDRDSKFNDMAAFGRKDPTVYYETIPFGSYGVKIYRAIKLEIEGFNGHPCLLSMSMDMTEDHARQLNSDALTDALMALQQDPMFTGPAKVLEIVRRRLDADFCYLARYDEENGVVSVEPDDIVFRGGWKIPKRLAAATGEIDATAHDHST